MNLLDDYRLLYENDNELNNTDIINLIDTEILLDNIEYDDELFSDDLELIY